MKKFSYYKSVFAMLAIATATAQSNPANFKKVQELGGIEEYQYQPNGMSILLVQDNSAPVATVQVVYRVGSKHEVTGNTGSTHLLEHLNFKGTPTFNKRKGTAIFAVLQNVGAQMNATTWYDRTNYFETIPSDQIELAIHIESDRMRNSLLLKEDKDAEMTVVRNEFERNENNPNHALNTEMWATAYMAYPYHHATIGWRADIENMPMEALRNFYNSYYWPDNATLTIIGDFQKEKIFSLIDKYFGSIGKAPNAIREPYTTEPEQYGPRRVVIKKPGQQSVVSIAYKIPGVMHADSPALDVLAEIIGAGPSSNINKTFVNTGTAINGHASASHFKEVNLFAVTLGLTPDKKQEEINAQLLAMIEKIKIEGVTQADVDRVVAKINAQSILSRDGSAAIASELNEAIAGGDWTYYFNRADILRRVKAADVNRVANQYLIENQSTTGYFIPLQQGGPSVADAQPVKVMESDSKQFFRNPELPQADIAVPSLSEAMTQIQSAYEDIKPTEKGKRYNRKSVAGIDVVSVKTGAKDMVTVSGSFSISDHFNNAGNSLVPGLTTQILSRGTLKNSKIQFSEKLEKLGISISINSDKYNAYISFKCLKKDLAQALSLLGEELRYPLFDEKEFELIKQRSLSGIKQRLDNPSAQGNLALMQSIYPKGNPNYGLDTQATLKELEAVTLDDLKKFHKSYFGTKAMRLVVVGDVDEKVLYTALNSNFKGFTGGMASTIKIQEPNKVDGQTKTIFIPKKSSAEMFIGQYTGLKRSDKDFVPFFIGTNILGGGFSGRLMMTVRDNEGLTYSIGAGQGGYENSGGYWYSNASFNPQLFEKGLQSTMVQIEKWAKEGVTEEELVAMKSNLIGSFKVGLATSGGLSSVILKNLERGFSPDYIEQYPKEIEAVSLEQVNEAIKKHVDLSKLIVIKAGTLEAKNDQ